MDSHCRCRRAPNSHSSSRHVSWGHSRSVAHPRCCRPPRGRACTPDHRRALQGDWLCSAAAVARPHWWRGNPTTSAWMVRKDGGGCRAPSSGHVRTSAVAVGGCRPTPGSGRGRVGPWPARPCQLRTRRRRRTRRRPGRAREATHTGTGAWHQRGDTARGEGGGGGESGVGTACGHPPRDCAAEASAGSAVAD